MHLIETLESRALLSASVAHAQMPALHQPAAPQLTQPLRQQQRGPSQTAAQKMEVRYMTEMIDHHHMAVMMGELAVNKAVHPELKALGQNIIATQSEEIAKMQTWLKDWYGIDYQPQMTKGEQRQMDKLASLSGSQFEIAFLKEMIPHHRMAVMMSRPIAQKAVHPELRQLAQTIITTQTAEIQQMQTWLKDWYGINTGGHGGGMGGGGMHGR